jgi:hypothetical protein
LLLLLLAPSRPGRYRHDSFCSWPVPDDDVWQVMMRLNSSALALVQARIAQLQQDSRVSATAAQQGKQQQLLQQQSGVQHGEPHQQQLAGEQQGKQQQSAGLQQGRQQQQQQQTLHLASLAPSGRAVPPDPTAVSSSSSSSSVTWNEQGVLAVKSSRRVPGLQLNLKPNSNPTLLASRAIASVQQQHMAPKQQQQQQPQPQQLSGVLAAAPAARAAAAGSTSAQTAAASSSYLQQQPFMPTTLSLRPAARTTLASANKAPAELPHTTASSTSCGAQVTPPPTAAAALAAAAVTPDGEAADPGAAATALAAAAPAAAAAGGGGVVVITASHFLPHPGLPHSRFSELGKAMGCCQLQLQLDQVRRVQIANFRLFFAGST